MNNIRRIENVFATSIYLYRVPPYPMAYPRRPMKFLDGLKCGLRNLITSSPKSITYLKEEYLWVIDDWSGNYYHWLFDVMPKLLIGYNELSHITVLLPKSMRRLQYVEETLRIFKFEVIYLEEKTIYKIKNCFCVGWLGYDNLEAINSIKSALINYYNINAQTNKKRIYVSRSDAAFRRINNETRLIALLERIGVETVVLSSMSWRDQIDIFFTIRELVT